MCRVEHSRVEQLFVCTQKMKLLEKPVKPIRAVSFFVSSSLFRQKSVEQTRVEQSQFEQFTMSLCFHSYLNDHFLFDLLFLNKMI